MNRFSGMASQDAESTIIAAILFDNQAYFEASEKLRADDFALDSHQRIFARMAELINEGRSVSQLTLVEELMRRGELQSVGGAAYIASILEGAIRNDSIRECIRIVGEKSSLRRLHRIGESLVAATEDPSSEPESIIERIGTQLMEEQAGTADQRSTAIAPAIVPLLDRLERERTRQFDLLGLPSGISCFDMVTRGLQEGEVTNFGAGSGVGKSSAMIQAACANCSQGTPTLLFSLEMTREQILRRILSAISAVPFPRVRDPKWASEEDMQSLRCASAKIADWPLHIVDASGLRVEKLVAAARLAIRRHGVRLVAVDYAQIVSADGRDERLRVAAVSRALTRLAKDEGVPVLVLSQLARKERGNPNRRPTMSDLRESSQLENDAHVVALFHRPWDEESGRLSSEAELIVAKQRSGETGVFPLHFDRRTLTFESPISATNSQQRQAAS